MTRPRRILLVEDHEDLRELLRDLLELEGFAVDVADDGQAAFDRLVAEPDLPDLLITDLDMPRMDGWTLLGLVRNYSRLAALPVIVISGSDRPAPPAHAFLRKPLTDPRRLVAAVIAVLPHLSLVG